MCALCKWYRERGLLPFPHLFKGARHYWTDRHEYTRTVNLEG